MEGRFTCCGKLPFAGHASDCPGASLDVAKVQSLLAEASAALGGGDSNQAAASAREALEAIWSHTVGYPVEFNWTRKRGDA